MSHYYDRVTGKPAYTVIGANGKERNTNVGDARKLNLVPSYSTITSVLDKPGVNMWMQNQIMDAALEWSFDSDWANGEEYDGAKYLELVSAWKKQVKEIANKLGKKGRDRGTMVHDALEKCYKGEEIGSELHSLIHPVVELIKHQFGLLDWVAEASFAKDGYGGKVDLHSKQGGNMYWATIDADGYENGGAQTKEEAMELADNYETVIEKHQGIVIDFKTKDVDDIKKMKPYPEDVMQHAAYRDGLDIPNAKCYSLFVNVKHPGMLVLHEWKEEDIQRAKKMFLCLRDFWYLSNKMEIK